MDCLGGRERLGGIWGERKNEKWRGLETTELEELMGCVQKRGSVWSTMKGMVEAV